MGDRMKLAMQLASKCWGRANRTYPEFVEKYLELAEQLLISKPIVTGDEFREFCAKNKLYRPKELHHNVWVSAVNALNQIGWIRPIKKITPAANHNHMDSVTMWESCIFDPSFKPSGIQENLF
jgi:hypothetical protein